MTKGEMTMHRAVSYHESVACCATCAYANYPCNLCQAVTLHGKMIEHPIKPQGSCCLWEPKQEKADDK